MVSLEMLSKNRYKSKKLKNYFVKIKFFSYYLNKKMIIKIEII